MILQANSPEVAVHVLSVNNCGDDFFAEVKTQVTVLFKKKTVFSAAHFDTHRSLNKGDSSILKSQFFSDTHFDKDTAPGASASVH